MGYIIVSSTSGDGYRFRFPKSVYPSSIGYVVRGKNEAVWSRKGDSFALNQKHTMTLEFSPERLIGLFDGVKILDVRNEHEFTVDTFMISTGQLSCRVEKLEIN